MRCFVISEDKSWESLFSNAGSLALIHAEPGEIEPLEGDVLFDLRQDAWDMDLYNKFKAPVFISAVLDTLKEHFAPPHIVRINGWAGMLAKPAIEAATAAQTKAGASELLAMIGKKTEWVDDVPGLVSPRVLAMIINEACMAEAASVSDAGSIDTAMKLGTNYPYGPFEWGEMIGMGKIAALLEKLSLTDNRYLSHISSTKRS